ncbi:hypothetical protein HL658_28945 [Azospirillum sp. RWY-5-1]|uniref:Permease n=1 Tax=Azospirillum oleiclasticum TaxID=2735135 RepID=A0ABX2TLU0_9PROT|nr:hypothetical protein [Azospirillum oleiclasticum]NYZ16591.1 hypothetical protein [Azospirillum oleiclasticum]NYZ24078.1 hypothetical protein [Azospirillum oleiclasticum]
MTQTLAPAAVPRLPVPSWSVQKTVNAGIRPILAAVAVLQFASLVYHPLAGPLHMAMAALLLLFLPLAAAKARRFSLILFGVIAAIVTVLAVRSGRYDLVFDGLSHVGSFAAFLAALQLLRVAANQSAAVRRVKGRFLRLEPNEVVGGFTVGAAGLGSFLSVGAHAVLAPLVGPDSPMQDRLQAALASIRGISFAAFWSPLFIAIAFVTNRMPDVNVGSIVVIGLAVALVSLTADLLVSGTRPRELRRILHGLQPLLRGGVVLAVALVAVAQFLGVTAMETVVIALPVLCLAFLSLGSRDTRRRALRTSYNNLANVSDEVMLVTAAVVFSTMLAGVPYLTDLVGPWLGGLPAGVVLVVAIVFMLAAGAVGLHPSISAALIISTFANLPDAVSRLALAEAIIIAWALAAVISPVGMTVMVAAQMFRVPYQSLILSRNLVTTLIISVATAIGLTLLDLYLRGL